MTKKSNYTISDLEQEVGKHSADALDEIYTAIVEGENRNEIYEKVLRIIVEDILKI